MTHQELKDKIILKCKQLDDKITDNEKLEFYFDMPRLRNLSELLNENEIIDFSIQERSNDDGSSWVQCEFWSEKLKCTVIYDYSVKLIFENLEELAEMLTTYQEKIILLERLIDTPAHFEELTKFYN